MYGQVSSVISMPSIEEELRFCMEEELFLEQGIWVLVT
jgi:hypothetical protein